MHSWAFTSTSSANSWYVACHRQLKQDAVVRCLKKHIRNLPYVLTSFWKSVDSLCEQRPSKILVWNRGTQFWEPSNIEVWDLSNRKEESGRRRHMSCDVVTRRSLLCLLTVASFCSTLGLFVTSPAHEAIAVLCVRLVGFIVLIAGLLVYSHCAQFETLLQASCNAAFWIYESIFVPALPGVSSHRDFCILKNQILWIPDGAW